MALVVLNTHPSKRQTRLFGSIGLPGFLLAAALGFWHRNPASPWPWLLLGAAALCEVATWIAPSLVRVVFVALSVLTFPIAWLVNHSLVVLLYFGVLTPAGWALRLFRGDPLRRARDSSLKSYWIPRKPSPTVERYLRPY